MRGIWGFGFLGLCLVAGTEQGWSQTQSDTERPRKRMPYVEAKPQLQPDLLQQFLRRMRGGEAAEVKPSARNNPMPAHYTYSGREFTGHYWEERIGDRDPTEILWVWLTGFQGKCDGRFMATSDAPVKNKGNVVHSGAWSCELKDMTLNGYFTVQQLSSTVGIFFTLPNAIDPKAARNMADQIHATLVEVIRMP
jgi:hypothetical protein